MQQLASRPPQPPFWPEGLHGFFEMMRVYLQHYVTLGHNMAALKQFLEQPSGRGRVVGEGRQTVVDLPTAVVAIIGQLRDACEPLGLVVSCSTLDAMMQGRLSTSSQIEVLLEVVKSEMSTKMVLCIPGERACFWERDPALPEHVRATFPAGLTELRAAGTAYACGLWNASVFHSMRAAEQGLLKLADDLSVITASGDQWGNIIEKAEAALTTIRKGKSSSDKAARMRMLSELLLDARLFKDAWRNHISHSLVSYNDGQAQEIMKSVARFLTAVSSAVLASP